MANNKFKSGDIVTVTDKNGEIKYVGIVKGWDYNLCTFEIEYDIDYYNTERESVFTLMGAKEERIQAFSLTDKSKGILDEMLQGAKRYEKLAYENCEKWVSAGYAGDHTSTDKLYCYCGEGNGYQGANITPASGIAVIYDTQESASATRGNAGTNGYGEKITLEPMEAYRYFNLLHQNAYKTAIMFINLLKNGI